MRYTTHRLEFVFCYLKFKKARSRATGLRPTPSGPEGSSGKRLDCVPRVRLACFFME